MGEMLRAEGLQVPKAEIRTASPDRMVDIGTPEEMESDVFNPEEARKRSTEITMKIDQLQASIDKQKADLQKSLEAAGKLNARPELVSELKEDAQEIIDDMEIQKRILEREKEDLEARLKM